MISVMRVHVLSLTSVSFVLLVNMQILQGAHIALNVLLGTSLVCRGRKIVQRAPPDTPVTKGQQIAKDVLQAHILQIMEVPFADLVNLAIIAQEKPLLAPCAKKVLTMRKLGKIIVGVWDVVLGTTATHRGSPVKRDV